MIMYTLWEMSTECVVVFPDGVEVLPLMLCGTNEIGAKTAEKMKESRVAVWLCEAFIALIRRLMRLSVLLKRLKKPLKFIVNR